MKKKIESNYRSSNDVVVGGSRRGNKAIRLRASFALPGTDVSTTLDISTKLS